MSERVAGLFLNPEVRTGGHRRYLELLQGLASRGREVRLVRNARLAAKMPAVRTLDLGEPGSRRGLPLSLAYALRLRAKKEEVLKFLGTPDWVLVFGETHFPAALLVKRWTRCRMLFSFRTDPVEEQRLLTAGIPRLLGALKIVALERFILSWADLIVFQSEYDQDRFCARHRPARGLVLRKARIIGNNANPSWAPAALADSNRSSSLKTILFLGHLNRRKGILSLIHAFRIMIREGCDLRLEVAGYGVLEEEAKRLVRIHGLEERVRFLGRIADPFALLKEADLLVVPSLFDSFPNVILEALFTGTPVLGSRAGGIPEMLGHDELLFDPGDPAAIAEKLKMLADDPQAYERVRELCAARRKAFLFDWVGAFESLLAEKRD